MGPNKQQPGPGVHMKSIGKHGISRVAAILVGAAMLVGCTAKPKTVLDQKATVEGFWTTHEKFCKFDYGNGMASNSNDPALKELHLKVGSKFKLKNRRTEQDTKAAVASSNPPTVDFLNVYWSSSSEIEDPDMRVFNENKEPLGQDYCDDGGDLSQHVYAFGIHDMTDSESGLTNPHAFIYIPMNVGGKAPSPLGNRHYLAILSIENDLSLCEPKNGSPRRPDYPRCVALRELAIMQMGGLGGKDFRDEIEKRISIILPPTTPYPALRMRFHNGVIHGNL
ncbi:MAG TPA: hypothetical protein VFV88_09190 [Steroidobacteraceae bacterium]|nr:hypothetical protein [Steroidobacteraceae bacterium]